MFGRRHLCDGRLRWHTAIGLGRKVCSVDESMVTDRHNELESKWCERLFAKRQNIHLQWLQRPRVRQHGWVLRSGEWRVDTARADELEAKRCRRGEFRPIFVYCGRLQWRRTAEHVRTIRSWQAKMGDGDKHDDAAQQFWNRSKSFCWLIFNWILVILIWVSSKKTTTRF